MPSSTPESQSDDGPETVTVSRKGQVTIVKAVREAVGIDPGDEVWVSVEGDRVVIEPVPTLEDLRGIHAREDAEPGEILAKSRELDRQEREREAAEMRELLERHGEGTTDESGEGDGPAADEAGADADGADGTDTDGENGGA